MYTASDLLVGLLIQPVYIANEITRNSLFHQEITESMAFSACGVSLLTMTAMSVDRFLALEYHMRYPNLMTTNRSMYISATIWFISILLSFLSQRKTVYCFIIAAFIFACLLICSFCYIGIYRILRRHQLQIHAQQQAVRNINGGNNQNVQRSMRSAKNTFIYYIVMIICYVPLFVTMSGNFSYRPSSLDKRLEHGRYFSIHELVNQSIFILLAPSRTSNGSS